MIPVAGFCGATAVNFEGSVCEVDRASWGGVTKLKIGGLRMILGRELLSELIVALAISHCSALSW